MIEEPMGDDVTVEPGSQESEKPGSDRAEIYTGRCVGGPLNGQVVQSRFPKGFVLVSKPNKFVWIYDYAPPGPTDTYSQFVCREPEGRTLEDQKRLDAAVEHDYDVRSM